MMQRAYRSIKVELRDAICVITLNVPERKNPIGPAMVNELLWALSDARDSDAVRVIVLTGAGDSFCAGADLKQIAGGDADTGVLELKGDFKDLLLRFASLGKPTIARVRGVAYGGGLGLMASCDFAIASDTAVLGTPEIKRGFFPLMIMAILSRVVPRRALMRMMLLGEKLSPADAMAMGLLSEVVPDDRLDEAVYALANKLAALSPTALRIGLAAFHRQGDQTMAEALPELQADLFALLGTDDAREGITAFMEKREPRWTGK